MTWQTAPVDRASHDAPVAHRDTDAPGAGATRASGPGHLARALRWGVLAIALALLTRFMVTGWPEVRASLSLLTAERLPLVVLAVVAEALWVYAMSQVYRSALMAFGGQVTRPTALRISMAAFTLSRILPGGGAAGGAVAARELIALGNPALRTIGSMLASWWITMTGLAALSFTGIAVAVAGDLLPVRMLLVPGVAVATFLLGSVGLVIAARDPRARRRIAAVILRGAARLGPHVAASAAAEPVASSGAQIHHRGLLTVFGWGLAVWITDATAMWLSLAAFGWHVDVGVLLVAYGAANLISALPELTPGWLGVLEVTVAVTLASFGVPQGVAAVSVLVYRLVSYWLPTVAGIPAATSVGRPPLRPHTVRPRLS